MSFVPTLSTKRINDNLLKYYGGPNGTCCKLYSCCKENKVAAKKIKLLQIKLSCCKLNKVAANLK